MSTRMVGDSALRAKVPVMNVQKTREAIGSPMEEALFGVTQIISNLETPKCDLVAPHPSNREYVHLYERLP
jgi:hypothetical protein